MFTTPPKMAFHESALHGSERNFMESLLGISIVIVSFAAWLNHILTCFGEGLWGFLVAGAIFFPIGIFHGVYLWFT